MSGTRLVAHPSARRFREGLKLAESWIREHRADAYRATSPRWALDDRLLDGEGARRQGGRWSAPGVRAAYLSESAESALSEFLSGARHLGLPDTSVLPAVVTWSRVRLGRVIDLTDPATCSALGLDLRRLLECDWRAENARGSQSESQAFGGAVSVIGVEAVRMPSAAVAGAVNLVLFVDHVRPDSTIETHGLPPERE